MAGIEKRLESYRNRFRLEGKVALVLGAASGIGKAAAESLAALGATVICADKNKVGVESTAAEIAATGRAESHVVDASDAKAIHSLAATIDSKHKRLDVAVSTPAIHVRKLMLDYTDEEYDRVVDLNLRGTFLFLRAFGRIMVRQRSGSLIASSSVRAHHARAGPRDLRRDQSWHHSDGARSGFRSRTVRRSCQRHRSQHRGYRTSRTTQSAAGNLEQIGLSHCIQSMGTAGRGGSGSGVLGLRRSKLHHRHRASGGRGVDCDRWRTVRIDGNPSWRALREPDDLDLSHRWRGLHWQPYLAAFLGFWSAFSAMYNVLQKQASRFIDWGAAQDFCGRQPSIRTEEECSGI